MRVVLLAWEVAVIIVATTDPPFERTVCACSECASCCTRGSGPLTLEDIDNIERHTGEPIVDKLQASQGTLVGEVDTRTREVVRKYWVGSIVLATVKGGRCIFLDEDSLCRIHEVAPFGCAYFDTHMPRREALPRGQWLLAQQQRPSYQALLSKLPKVTDERPSRPL